MKLILQNNIAFYIGVVFVLFVATSCNSPRYIYSPAAHNVPVLTKKGDSKIGAVYSTNFVGEETRNGDKIDNRSRGYDLHGAVAITDHFAVQASHFYRWEKSSGGVDSTTLRYKRNITEIGLGYYLPINETQNVFFQIFVGGGLGKFSFTDTDIYGSNFHETNITKIYLQPAFLFKSKGSFTTSVGLRFSNINYSKVKTSYTPSQQSDYHLDDLTTRGKMFFEPATVSSFGIKNLPGLRFEVQGGLSFLISKTYIDYRLFNFSIGTWVDVGALFSKNKQ